MNLVVELLHGISIKEKCLLYFPHLDKHFQAASMVNETHKKWVKAHYDDFFHPHVLLEGGLVLIYDQDWEKLGVGKFELLWHGPYVINHVLQKSAYELDDYYGNPLLDSYNTIYLKKYFA